MWFENVPRSLQNYFSQRCKIGAMHSTPGSLQHPGLLMHHSAGRPCPRRRLLQNQLQQPPQLRQQFSSLTSFEQKPNRCAARQRSQRQNTGSASFTAAPAAVSASLSNDGSPRQAQLRPLAMQLPRASSQLRRQQCGFRRRRRHDTQVCAAAAVLQPPVAGETLTQLAARFMARILLLACAILTAMLRIRYGSLQM